MAFQIDLKQSAEPNAGGPGPSEELQALALPFAPVLGVLLLLLGAFWFVNRTLDRSIHAQEETVLGLQTSVQTSKERLAELSGKRRMLFDVAREEIYWSDELRMLSEKLPDKLWLTQVRVVSTPPAKGPNGETLPPPAPTLSVDGGVLSASSEGNLDVIGKFIQDLQADPRFKMSFSSISLESVLRSPEPYTLNFRLKLSFRS